MPSRTPAAAESPALWSGGATSMAVTVPWVWPTSAHQAADERDPLPEVPAGDERPGDP